MDGWIASVCVRIASFFFRGASLDVLRVGPGRAGKKKRKDRYDPVDSGGGLDDPSSLFFFSNNIKTHLKGRRRRLLVVPLFFLRFFFSLFIVGHFVAGLSRWLSKTLCEKVALIRTAHYQGRKKKEGRRRPPPQMGVYIGIDPVRAESFDGRL